MEGRLELRLAQGFDRSELEVESVEDCEADGADAEDRGISIRVRCSQCAVMSIQGVFCHEHSSCPNEKGECKGCGEIISKHQKYCEECQ